MRIQWTKSGPGSFSFWAGTLFTVALTVALMCQVLYDPLDLWCGDWRTRFLRVAYAGDQLHQAAMTVGSILAAFTMAVAYTENRRASTHARSPRLSTLYVTLVSIASVAFVCAVSASGLYLFVHKNFVASIDTKELLLTLTTLSSGAGSLGMLTFLTAFGVLGYLTSRRRGRITTLIAIGGFCFMTIAVAQVAWIVLTTR